MKLVLVSSSYIEDKEISLVCGGVEESRAFTLFPTLTLVFPAALSDIKEQAQSACI